MDNSQVCMPGKACMTRLSNWPKSSSHFPGDTRSRCFLSMIYAISPKREEAIAPVEELKKDAPFPGGLAFIYASLDDRDLAFEWLEKSYRERDAFLVFLPILPEFRSLHSDPRFADLLRRIGLPTKRDVDFKPAEF